MSQLKFKEISIHRETTICALNAPVLSIYVSETNGKRSDYIETI